MIYDSNPFVRKTAFSALLELAEVPYMIRMNELEKIDSGEIYATLEQAKRILVECQKKGRAKAGRHFPVSLLQP